MSKKTLKKFESLSSEHFRKDKKLAEEFLQLALEGFEKDGDEKTLLVALRQVAIARGGFTKLATETGLSRENLYRALSSNGNPTFVTMKVVLQNLGYVFSFKRVRKVKKTK